MSAGKSQLWFKPKVIFFFLEIWILWCLYQNYFEFLKLYKLNGKTDRKNVGIWFKNKSGKIEKVAAIGIKVKKWVAYHGFALNISNNLELYKKIIPCGIRDRGVTNLKKIKNQNYKNIKNILIKNFLLNIKN